MTSPTLNDDANRLIANAHATRINPHFLAMVHAAAENAEREAIEEAKHRQRMRLLLDRR